MRFRCVLLNALPLNSFPDEFEEFSIVVRKISIDYMKRYLETYCHEVVSFIRHEATVKVLSEVLETEIKQSSELYRYHSLDSIFVVTLRNPVRGQEKKDIKAEDLYIFRIIA